RARTTTWWSAPTAPTRRRERRTTSAFRKATSLRRSSSASTRVSSPKDQGDAELRERSERAEGGGGAVRRRGSCGGKAPVVSSSSRLIPGAAQLAPAPRLHSHRGARRHCAHRGAGRDDRLGKWPHRREPNASGGRFGRHGGAPCRH